MKYFLKLFTLWAFLINSAFGQGDPAPFVKGIGSTGLGNSASTILVPNQQSTKINAYQALIETGNKNLLVNPSFEHSTITTGWTISNATTSKVSGPDKNALRLTLTGALSVVQDSTLNAANLIELQGVASIKIKTSTVDGLKVCARNDGVTTTLCVNVPKDGKWKEPTIPFSLSGTSNGIAIISTGTTGTVDLDDSAVGTSLPIQGVSGARLVGTLKYPAATNCQWATSSSSFADFAADTDCATPVVTGSLVARSTKIPGFTINNPQAGTYRIVASGLISRQTSVGQCAYRFYDGTNSSPVGQVGANATNVYLPNFEGHITLSSSPTAWDVSLQALSSTGTAGCYIELDTASFNEELTFSVYYFPPESKIYSQASQDYAYTNAGTITIGATTTAPTKGTVVVDRVMASRKGQRLNARYDYQQSAIGAAGSGDYLFSLPSGLAFDTNIITPFTGSINGSGPANAFVGNGQMQITGASRYSNSCTLLAYDTTRFRAVCGSTTTQGGTSGSYIVSSAQMGLVESTGLSYLWNLDAPIQGWQDYGVIVGSFAGIEKCANDYECTGEYTAHMNSSQVISNQNLEGWVTGNAGNPSTGIYTIPVKSGLFTQVPNCTATHTSTGSNAYTPKFDKTNSTTSSLRFIIMNTNSGNVVNVVAGEGFIINCQKAGVDFKPKTAKVASSIGVPTVPGITTTGTGNSIDTFSFSYGKTVSTACDNTGLVNTNQCAYLDQIGNIVSNITRNITGSYTINFGKTYSKLKCTGVFTGSALAVFDALPQCSSCSSVSFQTKTTSSGALTDTLGILDCKGSY